MKRGFEESQINEHSLPFTQDIRNYVYSYLKEEEVKINQSLSTVLVGQNVENDQFLNFVESFKKHSLDNINSFEGMLMYCITLCQITLLFFRNGAKLAPSIALGRISDFVKAYISTKCQSENTFWLRLGIEPQLSIKQLAAFSTEVEIFEIYSAKKEKLKLLYGHLNKYTKNLLTVEQLKNLVTV
ncbi:hypothetical protein TNCV_743121 [Trichonephila clavipes]|nr:hypothetical protein TNCV_743121 [Trichonephila clavipes]